MLRIFCILVVLWLPAALWAQPYAVEEARSVDSSGVKLIVLRDERAGIEAAVAPGRGGELSGLKVRFRGRWVEILYLARDYAPRDAWTGKAPFLWPATGRNFPPDLEARRKAGETFHDGAYDLDGKRYPMPIHGFARDLPWSVVSQAAGPAEARVLLSLRDSAETRKMYPFRFQNSVEYVLGAGRLEMRYKIRSPRDNTGGMFFSLGNHITFVTPLLEGSDPREMVLLTPSTQEILKTDYGIPTGEVRGRSHAKGIKLGDFERLRAVSLTGYGTSEPYIVLRDPQGLAVRMSHQASRIPPQPVVLYNVWGDAPGGFFSPEPWVGLQNSLVARQGLVYLAPGEEYDWTITIVPEREN